MKRRAYYALDLSPRSTAVRTLEAARTFYAKFSEWPALVVINEQGDDGTRCPDFETQVSPSGMPSSAGMIYVYGSEPEVSNATA